MSLSKTFVLLCAVLALSACGSSKGSQPAEESQAAAPPAIEAIDEPASIGLEMPPDDAASSSTDICLGDCKPKPDQAERFRRIEEEFQQAVKPANGTEWRAIAQLRLSARSHNARARLIAWRNQSDKLCIETEMEDENGGSSDGPWGPCVPESPCKKICLGLSGSGFGSASRYLLSGVVASEADTLRMTLDDGQVVDYGLTAPIVPGFHEYRVFMLDLGRDLERRVELVRDGKTIAEETRSPIELKMMRCDEDFPPVLPSQGAQGRSSPIDECLKKAGSQ